MAMVPTMIVSVEYPSEKKNEDMTTAKPTIGPTATSMPPVKIAHICPKPTRDSAVVSNNILSMLNAERNRALTLLA